LYHSCDEPNSLTIFRYYRIVLCRRSPPSLQSRRTTRNTIHYFLFYFFLYIYKLYARVGGQIGRLGNVCPKGRLTRIRRRRIVSTAVKYIICTVRAHQTKRKVREHRDTIKCIYTDTHIHRTNIF